MSRALTGSRSEANGRYFAELPRCRGALQRVRVGFDHAAQRDAWLEAAIAALTAGHTLPGPEPYRREAGNASSTPATSAARPMPTFEELAHGWLDEYYGQLRNADAERNRDARIMIELHLIPAFAGPVPTDPRVARKRLIDFVRRLALEPEWEQALDAAPGTAMPPGPATRAV